MIDININLMETVQFWKTLRLHHPSSLTTQGSLETCISHYLSSIFNFRFDYFEIELPLNRQRQRPVASRNNRDETIENWENSRIRLKEYLCTFQGRNSLFVLMAWVPKRGWRSKEKTAWTFYWTPLCLLSPYASRFGTPKAGDVGRELKCLINIWNKGGAFSRAYVQEIYD